MKGHLTVDGWSDKDKRHQNHILNFFPFSRQGRQRKTTYPASDETPRNVTWVSQIPTMSQLYLSSVTGSVHKTQTFGDLKLTLEKAGRKWQSSDDYNACETLALNCLCGIFSNASKRLCLANRVLTWEKLHVTNTKASAVVTELSWQNIIKNIRCVFPWQVAKDTHTYTHTYMHPHSVLCMRWLTCRDIWLVLDTLFRAAQWLNTTHNGRKKEKRESHGIKYIIIILGLGSLLMFFPLLTMGH